MLIRVKKKKNFFNHWRYKQNVLHPHGAIFVVLLQIEDALHKILGEFKVLYSNHAPQLKPRSQGDLDPAVMDTGQSDSIDPVQDMYFVVEGSALIPFMEVSILMGKLSCIFRFVKVHH